MKLSPELGTSWIICSISTYQGEERSMLVSKVMSCPVISATTTTTIIEAADSMRLHGVGVLPVFQEAVFQGTVLQSSVLRFDGFDRIEGTIVVGIVTDHDIVTRALADTRSGFDPDMRVAAIMSRGVITCYEDQDVLEAAECPSSDNLGRLSVFRIGGLAHRWLMLRVFSFVAQAAR